MTEPLLTARQLADYLGLSPATILDRFERGELPGFKLGNGAGAPVRFRTSEIEQYLERCRRDPAIGERNGDCGGVSLR